jgi:hypothetical protein
MIQALINRFNAQCCFTDFPRHPPLMQIPKLPARSRQRDHLQIRTARCYKVPVGQDIQSVQRLTRGWTVRGGFPHPSISALGPTQHPYNGYRVFPGGKAAGVWRWLSTPTSAEVTQRVQLYLYSTSGSSWPFIGWTLPLPFISKSLLVVLEQRLSRPLPRPITFPKYSSLNAPPFHATDYKLLTMSKSTQETKI